MVEFDQLEDPQRLAALTHDRNYAVTAGAGSGKTTTFAMRYLKLLEQTDTDPHSIAAITFTESGATELQERVRKSVNDHLERADGDEYEQWRAYHDALPEAYIHTIHGFCSRLLREYALEADVPVGFDVIEETAARGHQLETVETFVEEHLDDDRIERLTQVYYRDRLENLLADLLQNHHDARDWADEWADSDPDEYVEFVRSRYSPIDVSEARTIFDQSAVQRAIEDIQHVAHQETAGSNRIRIAQNVQDAVATYGGHTATLDDISVHDSAAAICEALTSDGTPYYGSFDSWCYTGHDDWDETNADRYEDATSTLVDAFPIDQWAIPDRLGVDRNAAPFFVALASLFQDLHEAYEKRKQRERVLDFTDLIDRAIELLQTTPTVRKTVRESFDHVMLDEVQDTDPRQWELVELLTSTADEYDGLNVFVVGDEKQSIFRFRGADVSQYSAERRRLEEANDQASVPLLENTYDNAGNSDLTRNFRSLPTVLEPINNLFDDLFGVVPETYRDAPPGIRGDDTSFEPVPQRLAADRVDDDDVGTDATFILVPEEQAVRDAVLPDDHPLCELPEDSAELDTQTLAAEVAAFLDSDPECYEEITAEDGTSTEEVTDLEPNDVAILIRKRTHLATYERALSDLNVPYTVASGIGFFESTEVVALRNLFAVLQDPTDDLALLGVLRSPLFGFEDSTVLALWEDISRNGVGEGELWPALAETESEQLLAARETIEAWRRLAGTAGSTPVVETWDALLGQIIEDTGFLASLALDERGQQAIANVEKFRDQLRSWNEDGLQTLPEVVDRIEREVELSTREGEAAVPENADGVRIMTVHDAKGLEFPAVFVPGLSTGFNLRPGYGDGIAEFETIEDPSSGDSISLLGIRGRSVDDVFEQQNTICKRRLRFHRKREAIAEEKRILYVAATRARDHLSIIGTVGCEDESVESLVTGDADDPSNWFDLIGPELLTDDVLEVLATTGTATVGNCHDHPATVRFPRAGVELGTQAKTEPPVLARDVSEYEINAEYSIAASYLGSLVQDDAPGDVIVDHTGQYVSYYPPEEDSSTDGISSSDDPSYLPRNVFGDIVHKLVELDSDLEDQSFVRQLAEQFAIQHDVDPSRIDGSNIAQVQRHAQRAIDYLDSVDAVHTVDEKPVRATLGSGEVYGDIDHLSVTDDTYHIVDYKTNAITDLEAIEEKASFYEWQMKAYAVALYQADRKRTVEATLLFTEANEPKRYKWSPDELADLYAELDTVIKTSLSGIL